MTATTISRLHQALTAHARTNDKSKLLSALSTHLKNTCLPLEPAPPLDPAVALQDISRERVILNGVPFLSASSGVNNQFLEAIYELCEKMCDMDDVRTRPQELVEGLFMRMARSGSGADSYFKLNSIMGSPDLILMPRQPEGNQTLPPPILVDLYVAGGQIHAIISCTNMYGLFRKADITGIKTGSNAGGDNAAWINVDAVVEERVNFGNGDSVRFLKAKFPSLTKLKSSSSKPKSHGSGIGLAGRKSRASKYISSRAYRDH
mmetsp:Transcript_105/g.153  ORF Transcript_105/g.153 Transcript_105/m.153 type:complete len:262 (+) Transcript_105:61-846(+)|eukprot:CAMPEP_0172512068 /NCGR_PEP_ID=MMETSP1066-20121228/241520_1 /TAXON_ID=671091 /ORGANISM="Coscinodiscus wailesii, Strain CCMP2513" /LENGTH=261 /DNA_ID=CAMNT_0013291705 /DNA_START=39 /DNA_END=824 /DNA_ORIENTATION=-